MVKRCGPLHPPSNVGTKCVGPDVKSQEMQSGAFISHGWGLHQLAFAAPSGLPSSSLTMSTFGNIGMWGRRGRGLLFRTYRLHVNETFRAPMGCCGWRTTCNDEPTWRCCCWCVCVCGCVLVCLIVWLVGYLVG